MTASSTCSAQTMPLSGSHAARRRDRRRAIVQVSRALTNADSTSEEIVQAFEQVEVEIFKLLAYDPFLRFKRQFDEQFSADARFGGSLRYRQGLTVVRSKMFVCQQRGLEGDSQVSFCR